jgi:hypothetical protein
MDMILTYFVSKFFLQSKFPVQHANSMFYRSDVAELKTSNLGQFRKVILVNGLGEI